MFKSLFDVVTAPVRIASNVVHGTANIAVSTLAATLKVSESAVNAALDAGCKTASEIEDWIDRNL